MMPEHWLQTDKNKNYAYQVAVAAIFQNEAAYLKEWIEFHKLVGVEHFYLFNNSSSDNYDEVLLPYVKSGLVDVLDWKDLENRTITQNCAYNTALEISEDYTKWLAVLDIDEFLFPVESYHLADFLKNYEDAAGICVNWQIYGTSHIKKLLPNHLLIEDLIWKAPQDYHENFHVKSIVRPEFALRFNNPHYCEYSMGAYQVNPDKKMFYGALAKVCIDKIRINHYWTRDEEFLNEHKIKGRKPSQELISKERLDLLNSECDKAIYKYVPRLRQAMGFPK